MRAVELSDNEYYHIYNRGVDKRPIIHDTRDCSRFIQSMLEFNTCEPIGGLHQSSFTHVKKYPLEKPLVDFIAYCINPNHFHFVLKQRTDRGIEKFMHRIATGYTMYFNSRYKRSGSLFQGPFKACHIDSNEYLLRVSVYVNLNNRTHELRGSASKLVRSSWCDYVTPDASNQILCYTSVILDQFANTREYRDYALSTLKDIVERKKTEKAWQYRLID